MLGVMDTASKGFAQIDETFPEQLREARKRLGVSQELLTEEMAKRGFPVHLTTIGKIERKERKVTIGEAAAIADALALSLDSMIGGQSTLQSAYAAHNDSRRAFENAVHSYALSLLDIAVAADQATELREVDSEWLTESMPDQTPARMTQDAGVALEAAISRESIARGRFVEGLLASIRSDSERLANYVAVDIDPEIRYADISTDVWPGEVPSKNGND